MTRAEEAALEAYPIQISEYSDSCKQYDSNESDRLTYQEAYEQAEKDTIEKAVKWLKANWRNYVWLDADKIIHFGHWESDFRKAMEE